MLVVCASCKKEFTCTCVTTYVYKYKVNNQPPYKFATTVLPGKDLKYAEKLTLAQARAACNDEQNAIESSFLNAITNNGTIPLIAGESISSSCGLK